MYLALGFQCTHMNICNIIKLSIVLLLLALTMIIAMILILNIKVIISSNLHRPHPCHHSSRLSPLIITDTHRGNTIVDSRADEYTNPFIKPPALPPKQYNPSPSTNNVISKALNPSYRTI